MILMAVSVEWRTHPLIAEPSKRTRAEEWEADRAALQGSGRMESSQMKTWDKGRVFIFVMRGFFLCCMLIGMIQERGEDKISGEGKIARVSHLSR